MIDPATLATGVTLAKALEKPIASIFDAATGPLKNLAAKWSVAGKKDAIVQTIAEVELVRTISSQERVPLSQFYYPARIQNRMTANIIPSRKVRLASESIDDKNIVIYGTVGQGKSIFMRYLCPQELIEARRIPIFVEFRSIDAHSTLRETLLKTLELLGFGKLSEGDLGFLLKTGSLIIFLDGFDEIKRELIPAVTSELITLTKISPQTRWVISSRPGSLSAHLSGMPFLHRVSIAPLADEDFEPFLTALQVPQETRDKLISAIAKSPIEIRGILKTPLMLTLLNMTFGTSTHVPTTLHEFYESMFLFLVYRHDETKPGFIRAKVT